MWEYRANVLDVLDGDTIRVLVDVGFNARCEVDVRLLGVRAPERSQPGGLETKVFVQEWLTEVQPLKWPLLIRTSVTKTIEPTEQRTFTRYVAAVERFPVGDTSLNMDVITFLSEHPEWGTGV